jgi:hypothetical protein
MSDEQKEPNKVPEGRFDSLDCLYLNLDLEGPSPGPKRPLPPKVRAELLRLRALYYPDLPPLPEEPPADGPQEAGS